MSELAHDLCRLAPTRSLGWSDGSGAGRYGPFVALFDSGSNVEVYEVPDDQLDRIWSDLDANPAESWLIWDCFRVLSEPDDDPNENPEPWQYVRSTLGLEVEG